MVLNLPSFLLIVLGGIWAIGITIFSIIIYRTISRLTAGTGKLQLDEVLDSLRSDLRREQQLQRQIEKEVSGLRKEMPLGLRKVGLVRFNPFPSTGGNQSFALALLDGTDSGVVVTSLHSREGTRLYAKSIKIGKGQSDLSKEEQLAVRNAVRDTLIKNE
jgi:hypothetical protein